MKTVTAAKDFPNDKQAHLCVVEFVSEHRGGEPNGRGGREMDYTEHYSKLHLFDNEQELIAWVERAGSYTNYVVITGQRVGVSSTTQLRY